MPNTGLPKVRTWQLSFVAPHWNTVPLVPWAVRRLPAWRDRSAGPTLCLSTACPSSLDCTPISQIPKVDRRVVSDRAGGVNGTT
jgi:hypothetical protein